jgi:hypothetical protein
MVHTESRVYDLQQSQRLGISCPFSHTIVDVLRTDEEDEKDHSCQDDEPEKGTDAIVGLKIEGTGFRRHGRGSGGCGGLC